MWSSDTVVADTGKISLGPFEEEELLQDTGGIPERFAPSLPECAVLLVGVTRSPGARVSNQKIASQTIRMDLASSKIQCCWR